MNNSMEKLASLRDDLEKKAAEDAELNAQNFNTEENTSLTPQEAESIEKMKAEMGESPTVLVNDTDNEGHTVQIPAHEYAKSLDGRKVLLTGPVHDETRETLETALKVINSGDIERSAEQLREDAKTRAIHMFRTMSVNESTNEMDDESYIAINDSAIEALKKFFNTDRLLADDVIKKLRKLPMKTICEIIPKPFLEIYLTPQEIKLANIQAKDRLLTVIAYLTTTGPELDYLNEYIDEENKLILVSKRLMQCQVDFAEMLKDDAVMSDLIAKSRAYAPADTTFWSKYIQFPNRVHNEFAQRVVIFAEYEKAYTKILEEYPDCDENTKARAIILNEIQECQMKQKVYQEVCDLTLMKELWDILVARLKINKKTSMQSLIYEATEAIEKVRRCKQNLPFPGYQGNERKADQILANYTVAFNKMVVGFNSTIDTIAEKNETGEDSCGVVPVHIDGYDDTDVITVYSIMLVILMGRILKRCTRNDATKYDAITLDAYFQMFCKIGTDIYIMRDVWDMTKDFIKYVLDTYYLPEKRNYGKKGK